MERLQNGIIQSELLLNAGVVCGTSTKELGNMSFDRSQKGRAPKNFQNFLEKLGIDPQKSTILILRVKHTANIAYVQLDKNKGRIILNLDSKEITTLKISMPAIKENLEDYKNGIDAAVGSLPNLYLAVLHADCAPVLIYDLKNKQYALIHVGILGIFNGIVGNTINFMAEYCQTEPQYLFAYIGPSICGRCYKLSQSSHWPLIQKYLTKEQQNTFEIRWAVFHQLIASGLTKLNIEMSGFCTACHHKLFFSNHCASNQAKEGRNMTIIGLR